MLNLQELVAAALKHTLPADEVDRYELAGRVVGGFEGSTRTLRLHDDVLQSILVSTAYKIAPHFDPGQLATFGGLAAQIAYQQAVNHLRAESRHELLKLETRNLNAPSHVAQAPFAYRRESVYRTAIYLADRARRAEGGQEDVAEQAERRRFAAGAYRVARIAVFRQLCLVERGRREIALLSGFGWVPSPSTLVRLWAECRDVFDRFIGPRQRLTSPEAIGGSAVARVVGLSPSAISRRKQSLKASLDLAVEQAVIHWSIRFRQYEGGRFPRCWIR